MFESVFNNKLRFEFQDIDLCQYVGHIRDVKDSWAAISTCRGLRGVIYDGKTMHYVQAGKGLLFLF